jgi:outer membrane protein
VGILPPVDMAQADAGVAAREEAIVVAEHAFQAACDQLRMLLGFPSDAALWEKDLVLGDRPPVAAEAPGAGEAVRSAFENRPEWKRVGLEGANSRLELDFARNQRLPKLNLNASYGASGTTGKICVDTDSDGICDTIVLDEGASDAWSQVTGRDNPSWSVGLSFSYAVRNRAASSAYERARLMEEQYEISRESLETRILAEVRGAVRDVETNLKRVEAARANRVLQQRRLDIETERYRNGLSTVFQVLDAQAELTAAEASELRATLDYHRSTVALDKAMGTLAPKRGVSFASSDS